MLTSLDRAWLKLAIQTLIKVVQRKLASEESLEVRAIREREISELRAVAVKLELMTD